jgi:phytoene dehydrogenase-like protein
MERYDAAVIGAGPDGLIAAHRLASGGLKVIVLEGSESAGGLAVTKEFHPGFRASLYADELAAVPARLFRELDLPRRGAVLLPQPAIAAVSDDRFTLLYSDPGRMIRGAASSGPALAALRRDLDSARTALSQRLFQLAGEERRSFLKPLARRPVWPGEEWGARPLADTLAERIPDPALGHLLAAHFLSGTSASPFLTGSGLHALRGFDRSGSPRGGLGALTAALLKAALAAGVTFRYRADIAALHFAGGRKAGVVLAGGEEVLCRTVVSTRDVKRTFLGLVPWSDMPEDITRRVVQFRMGTSRARVLVALDALPEIAFASERPEAALGPIHVSASIEALSAAHTAARAGLMSEAPPATIRFPSLQDPMLAPIGKAVMTVTLSAIPARLVDGEWDAGKREAILKCALAAAARVVPGIDARVLAVDIVTPRDLETALAASEGDLDGGELAPDQALGFRPFPEWREGRTPLRGLYLGGPSAAAAPFLLGAGGAQAAERLLADISRARAA